MQIPRSLASIFYITITILLTGVFVKGQGIPPYPNAITNRDIIQETPMTVPPVNVVVTDPDFGSSIVRATDETTNFKLPGTALTTEASGAANEWSVDTGKFYITGQGGQVLVFSFDPSTMVVSSLSTAQAGQGLLLPLRPGPTFSFVDPDLIYGHTNKAPLTITSYRFSTGVSTPVIDTTTCGMQPPLGSGPLVRADDDVTLSLDDSRVSISEGGPVRGTDMFVVVYDTTLGCRWYNTQTGQIGGQWGPLGTSTVGTSYLIRHAYLARSGNYVHILTDDRVSYWWEVGTLNVTSCALGSHEDCAGYGAVGYNTYVNSGLLDDMQTVKRPISDLTEIVSLLYPLPSPPNQGVIQHFTWSNVDVNDSVPVCGSTYTPEGYDTDRTYNQPWEQEIWCVETDELASTVWRFAHNRAIWEPPYFNTQPLGNVSQDGNFFLYTSDWDTQLGTGTDGRPRSDVFIVNLDCDGLCSSTGSR